MLDLNQIYLMDCMEGMKQFPDKYFELAIVDPPYGINATKMNLGEGGGLYRRPKKYKRGEWDSAAPDDQYFSELFRVSKNQIVWGANHFIEKMPFNSSCWILWDKNNGGSDFADGELSWTSFKSPLRIFKYTWSGFIQDRKTNTREEKTHPTQKPIALYRWALQHYAKPGDKILDTHGGSFSSIIACLEMGFEYIAFEIDEEYYNNGLKRIETYLSQPKIFTPEQIQPKQLNLL